MKILWGGGIKPFKNHFSYYLFLFLLTSLVPVSYFVSHHHYVYVIYIIANNFAVTYLLVLIRTFIRNKLLNRIYTIIIDLAVLLMFLVELFCFVNMNSPFTEDIAAIILGTNLSEAQEFFNSFFSVKFTVIVLLATVIIVLLCIYIDKIRIRISKTVCGILLICLFIGMAMVIHNKAVMNESLFVKYSLFFKVQSPPDLKMYEKELHLIKTSEAGTDNADIVLIIGEALSKSHCSLYAYGKKTNPLLTALAEDSYLYVFNNVISADIHTVASFKCIMSTYKNSLADKVNWYECTTLPNVMKHCGYKTYWISNQSKKGFYDNVIGKYSELCTDNSFVGNAYKGMSRVNKDEEILPLLRKKMKNVSGKSCYFIHLMGQHEAFSKRYTPSFARFTEKDYPDLPKKQRKNIAEYDNSVLYNDYVVNEIIKQFKDRNAIVFYFPDHALDLYESSDDWCAHAKPGDKKSIYFGRQIPFVVYMSQRYKDLHSEIVDKVRKNTNREFSTEDIIYSVMDIIGVDFEDGSVKKYSLFR